MNSIRNLARLLGIDNVVLVKAAVWYFRSLERERQYEVLDRFFKGRGGKREEIGGRKSEGSGGGKRRELGLDNEGRDDLGEYL